MLDQPITKVCSKCRELKPAEAFAKDKSRKSGLQPRCRECTKKLQDPWRETNREYLRQEAARYKAENVEKRRESLRKFAETHKEQEAARLKRFREEHREEERLRNRLYHAKHPQQSTARMAAWRAANRERAREAIRRFRTMRKNAWVEDIDMAVLYERDGGICQICKLPVERMKATVDHIIPISQGGLHEYSNVQIAHGPCNSGKGARLDYIRESLT